MVASSRAGATSQDQAGPGLRERAALESLCRRDDLYLLRVRATQQGQVTSLQTFTAACSLLQAGLNDQVRYWEDLCWVTLQFHVPVVGAAGLARPGGECESGRGAGTAG